jgi:hypothetical protein
MISKSKYFDDWRGKLQTIMSVSRFKKKVVEITQQIGQSDQFSKRIEVIFNTRDNWDLSSKF